jgi:hypothetical protein
MVKQLERDDNRRQRPVFSKPPAGRRRQAQQTGEDHGSDTEAPSDADAEPVALTVTPAEARRQAEAEGPSLVTSSKSSSGIKGVYSLPRGSSDARPSSGILPGPPVASLQRHQRGSWQPVLVQHRKDWIALTGVISQSPRPIAKNPVAKPPRQQQRRRQPPSPPQPPHPPKVGSSGPPVSQPPPSPAQMAQAAARRAQELMACASQLAAAGQPLAETALAQAEAAMARAEALARSLTPPCAVRHGRACAVESAVAPAGSALRV